MGEFDNIINKVVNELQNGVPENLCSQLVSNLSVRSDLADKAYTGKRFFLFIFDDIMRTYGDGISVYEQEEIKDEWVKEIEELYDDMISGPFESIMDDPYEEVYGRSASYLIYEYTDALCSLAERLIRNLEKKL